MQRCSDPHCQHLNRPGARYCERCGGPLSANQSSPLRVGQLLRGGAYRILEPLGMGGMGVLYLAADTDAFDRKCVIKELLDYYDLGNPDEARKAQARFEREARLLAALSHPGIPRIYSYFSEAGRNLIVMEYIEGDTLLQSVTHLDSQGRQVTTRPLPAEEVVRHAIRVCQVLEYLGSQPTAVIHHDVKPANLIVDRTSGEVRLVDFGTAHTRPPRSVQASSGRTATSLFGTEGYAAPEQFEGRSEPRSDVYALAATTYHLLTDDDPAAHPFQFPRLSTLPAGLSDALAQALRPQVRRRCSALDLRQALEAWLIPEDAQQPFVFRGGAAAHTTADLVALCEQNWAEARKHLLDGDFDRWFRARSRHDLVARASSARTETDANAALETFVRRLDPRLPPPRLSVEPQTLDFGRVSRGHAAVRRLVLRNPGRGYAQATLAASVPWIDLDPARAGCLRGEEAAVEVRLKTEAMPLRRDHQAVLACTSPRGARISIPVEARLNIATEALQRMVAAARAAVHLASRGVRRGCGDWSHTFSRLLRSRYGPWVLLGELLVLDIGLVALWWGWQHLPPDLFRAVLGLLRALPLALLAVYVLPVLAFAAFGVFRELIAQIRHS